jgi:hypothetical protein
VLTETRFKEFYEQAERLRALGGHAAAGELLLFLFDHGRHVGGYGIVRLSFVLRDLSALADLANPRPDPAAQRIRAALERRRDEREQLANLGDAGFSELQELVALNRALGQPQRSHALFQALQERGRAEDAIAEVRRVLSSLMLEAMLPGDAEKIAEQYEYEHLKRMVLELEQRAAAELATSLPQESEIAHLGAEIKHLCDRHRAYAGQDLPRGEQDKRRVAELAHDIVEILSRHSLIGGAPSGEGIKVRLWRLSRDLAVLIARHEVRGDLLRDRDLRNQLVSLARDTAARIAESRINEDLAAPDAQLLPAHREALAARIQHDGLLAYEALLRIGEDALAERVGAWMLAFRQNEEMYGSLAAAARRARKPAVESRLQEEARRLSTGP